VFGIERRLDDDAAVILLNFTESSVELDFNEVGEDISKWSKLQLTVSNYDKVAPPATKGVTPKVVLQPYEGRLYLRAGSPAK
jgi:hypothetical protein